MTIQEIIGEENYRDDMTVEELNKFLDGKNLVDWNDNKHTTKAKFIEMEEKFLAEKKKRKEFENKISELENASLSEADKQAKEYESLQNEIAALKLEKTKADTKAMYSSMGYNGDILEELVEVDFYDGADKLDRKAEVLKRANDYLLADRTKSLMTSDNTPKVSTQANISKAEMYRKQFNDCETLAEKMVVANRAANDGITL